jgi:hypothetical protein
MLHLLSNYYKTYAQKPGFCAEIGDEPQGSFQKPGFFPTLRKSCTKESVSQVQLLVKHLNNYLSKKN